VSRCPGSLRPSHQQLLSHGDLLSGQREGIYGYDSRSSSVQLVVCDADDSGQRLGIPEWMDDERPVRLRSIEAKRDESRTRREHLAALTEVDHGTSVSTGERRPVGQCWTAELAVQATHPTRVCEMLQER